MARTPAWDATRMAEAISGEQLKDARSRARLTQRELATLLNVSERLIQKWEREGVASGREGRVRAVLGEYLDTAINPPLHEISNWALLMELGRRLEDRDPTVSGQIGRDASSTHTVPPNNLGGTFTGRRGPRHPKPKE